MFTYPYFIHHISFSMKPYLRCELASEIPIREPTFDTFIIPSQPKMEIDTPGQSLQTTASCHDGCHDGLGQFAHTVWTGPITVSGYLHRCNKRETPQPLMLRFSLGASHNVWETWADALTPRLSFTVQGRGSPRRPNSLLISGTDNHITTPVRVQVIPLDCC